MNQFKIHRINNSEDMAFAEFWRIYTTSFPLFERRLIKQQTAIFNKSRYQLDVYSVDNHFVGFISHWIAKEFTFIEHLAISPQLRSKGFGNAVLKNEMT